MSNKTLVLIQKTHVLRIYCGDELRGGLDYSAIFGVTKLRMTGDDWCDIYNGSNLIGFVSGVKEVTEVW